MNYRISDLKIVEGLKALKTRLQENRRRARLNWADVFEFMLTVSWDYLDKPQSTAPPTNAAVERSRSSTVAIQEPVVKETPRPVADKSVKASKGVTLPAAQELDF